MSGTWGTMSPRCHGHSRWASEGQCQPWLSNHLGPVEVSRAAAGFGFSGEDSVSDALVATRMGYAEIFGVL